MANNIEKISDAELEVMKVIWSKTSPSTYTEIRAVLGCEGGWDTSTIRTLIGRLVGKGVLLQEKKDVYYYSPAISETEFIEARTKEFLHKIFKGDVKHLISTMLSPDVLTPEELEDVREFWNKGKNANECDI